MHAVMPVLLPDVASFRKRNGGDQWDEMWEGVLHMCPMPTPDHQDLGRSTLIYVSLFWANPIRAKVFYEANLASVGGWPKDYRIPDLLLLRHENFHVRKRKCFEGPVDGVVEFHSPGDEAYEKLEFYAKLGVGEVWIIHRDTKVPEIYLLKNGGYVKQRATGGWVRSPLTGLEMKKGKPGKLAIRKIGDDATRADLPEY